MTSKQAHIAAYVAAHPGCITADIHRAIGHNYAHGHHRFTYESVDRMLRNGMLKRVPLPRSNSTSYLPRGLAVA